MRPNPQFSMDLATFTEEILNGKLHFLCSGRDSVVITLSLTNNYLKIYLTLSESSWELLIIFFVIWLGKLIGRAIQKQTDSHIVEWIIKNGLKVVKMF